MSRAPVSARAGGGEEDLDLVEALGTHELLVTSRVASSVPEDDPLVVGVTQQVMDAVVSEGPLRQLARCPVAKPLFFEMSREAVERPLAGRVQIECKPDERGPLRIKHDATDVPARDQLSVREVADGWPEGCAATFVLLA